MLECAAADVPDESSSSSCFELPAKELVVLHLANQRAALAATQDESSSSDEWWQMRESLAKLRADEARIRRAITVVSECRDVSQLRAARDAMRRGETFQLGDVRIDRTVYTSTRLYICIWCAHVH